MSDVEKNIRLIELGYNARSQGLDLDTIKSEIIKLHVQ